MYVISFPADQHYNTPQTAGVPQYENSKQIFTGKRRLVNLYVLNNSAATVYLAVCDTATTQAAAGAITVYPIAANSFVSVAQPSGDRFEAGLFL
jgi:hypothetical protein